MTKEPETAPASIPAIIYDQLGGSAFRAMTGCSHFVGDKDTLRMHIGRNLSRANRLDITYSHCDDLYTMRFYRYDGNKLNTKTMEWIPEKITEVAKYEGVFCDSLQEIFTKVTGMYTHL